MTFNTHPRKCVLQMFHTYIMKQMFLNKTVNNLLTFLLATKVLFNQENTNNLKKCSKIICVLAQPRKHN